MNALFLSEIITPVIRCEESFRNESFVNVTEDPEIEAVKNIEINLIEVNPVECGEEREIQKSNLEMKTLITEKIVCKQTIPLLTSPSLKYSGGTSVSSKEKTEQRPAMDQNGLVQVKKRSGPILNSVQIMLNAGTLYNMNYV